eukprot:364458-Chlamydomonas_euryale.AAC.1
MGGRRPSGDPALNLRFVLCGIAGRPCTTVVLPKRTYQRRRQWDCTLTHHIVSGAARGMLRGLEE